MRQVTAARIANEAFAKVGVRADAALTNERLTRERVERLEAIVNGNLSTRLRWLFGMSVLDVHGTIGASMEQSK
jgi:hypothetical protein